VYRQVVTLADPETATNYMRVGGNGAYVDVRNVVALPLPTGAATETTVAGLLTNTQLRASAVETTKKTSSFNHITTNTTTTVKSGAGVLRRIVINTKGSSANTLTIYDNTTGSGTVIGVIDTVNGVSGHFEYGVSFSTGLTIVTANGTAADVTVIYE
jgi:microcompartment protein CcmK/EutM